MAGKKVTLDSKLPIRVEEKIYGPSEYNHTPCIYRIALTEYETMPYPSMGPSLRFSFPERYFFSLSISHVVA